MYEVFPFFALSTFTSKLNVLVTSNNTLLHSLYFGNMFGAGAAVLIVVAAPFDRWEEEEGEEE